MVVRSAVVDKKVYSYYEIRLLHGQYYLYENGRYTGTWFRKDREAKRYLKGLREVEREPGRV
jgi:hypothetical protein